MKRYHRTERSRREFLGGALAATLALAVTGCGSSGGTEQKGGAAGNGTVDRNATVKIAIDSLSTNFDPIQNIGSGGNYTLPQVYDQLLQLDEKLNPKAMLATKWQYNDDGTELTMTLRDDAVFNDDGSKLDAAAVKTSVERAKNDKSSLVAGELAALKGVEAVDATTVKFTFSAPSYSFLSDLAGDPRISSVVNPKRATDGSLVKKPAGSGPYTLTSATQSKMVFDRVAKHWDTSSGLAKRLEVQAIMDAKSRLNALRGGQLDVVAIGLGQATTANGLVKSAGLQTFYSRKAVKYLLEVNTTGGSPLAKLEVRQAISKAIDRTAYTKTVLQSTGDPSVQAFSPSNAGYDSALDAPAELKAQPAEAKALLKKAGVSGLKISILALAGSTTNAEVLQQQLADVGITASIETQSNFAGLIQGWQSGKYDTYIGSVDTWDPAAMIRSGLTTMPQSGGVPDYLKDAVAKADSAALGDARDQAFHEVNKILTEKPVHIPLADADNGLIASGKVVGLDTVRLLSFSPAFEMRRIGLSS
ncbi:ABC transporter substrate-binding protein [Streptomyces mangrovisoli]|uniref:Solute-binding protein family 5 domain-containing protein n=1 Tax=Streptomyces mangrovisoli TaxID=1428628 RepID=A0A1J4NU18_9ACTN|nr:ABC transporter substrate-binding protein [Streptomyces mangrovisoli]OIJ65028.1 hypothetical protein WN71_025870 [Streptomyces mangrovisoli]